MTGVKIVIFLFVVTILWTFVFSVMMKGNEDKKKEWRENGKFPFWYLFMGLLIWLDVFGLGYVAFYFLFLHTW